VAGPPTPIKLGRFTTRRVAVHALGCKRPRQAASGNARKPVCHKRNLVAPHRIQTQAIALGVSVNRLVAGSNPARGAK
jgi:hypothetical protein